MNSQRLRFSVRSLFIMTTLAAIFVELGIQFPFAAELGAILAVPICFSIGVAFLMNHYPTAFVRLILAAIGTFFVLVSVSGWLDPVRGHDESEWVLLVVMGGIAVFFYYIAWTAVPAGSGASEPSKNPPNDRLH